MIDINGVSPGQHIKMKNGDIAEVLENPGDGSWLFVRLLSSGEEEAVFAEVIAEVVSVSREQKS